MSKLSELLRKADALKTAAEMKGGWSEEDAKLYEGLLTEAEGEKKHADAEARHAAIKAWAEKPDGQSVVKAGFADEALPGEGNAEGVTAGGYEMYATSKLGERKLTALKSGAYKDAFRDYITNSTRHGAEWRGQMKGEALKVLQEGRDDAGGFWIPPDVRSDLIKKMAATAVIRRNAYAFTTGSDMVTFPKVTYTTDNKYTSGVRFSWTAEAPATSISEATNPVAGRVTIPVYTATAAIILTRAMIEDSQFDVLGFASNLLGEAFGLGEEDAFTSGDGAGKPEGILTHSNATVAHASGGMYVFSGSSANVTWAGATIATPVSTQGLLGTEAALPPQYENGAKWYFNKSTKAMIRSLVDTTGRPLWIPQDTYPTYANGYTPSLLGYGFESAQFMPDPAADSKSVLFGDLGGYYIADRVGLSVEVLREVRALQDEVVLYARKRVGAKLVHDWRVKLLKLGTS